MLKGKNRLGVSLHSRRRMYEFHRRAEEHGKSLPAAITLGTIRSIISVRWSTPIRHTYGSSRLSGACSANPTGWRAVGCRTWKSRQAPR